MNELQLNGNGGRSRLRYFIPILLMVPVLAVVALFVVTASSTAKISVSGGGLAAIKLPLGGGTIEHVSAAGGREHKAIPVVVRGNEVWPSGHLTQGERITVVATIKRPGWVSWLAGGPKKLTVTEVTPSAKISSEFVTRRQGAPVEIKFNDPVAVLGTGDRGAATRTHLLTSPRSSLTLDERATAGTVMVAAAARRWEQPTTHAVSWFPAGTKATAVASPAPGATITPDTQITLTFSKPVAQVLHNTLPKVEPAGSGTWQRINTHTLRFVPAGYGYGLGAHVLVRLPAGVHLIGGTASGSDPVGAWTVPGGSTKSLQVLLADLGYLPVSFTPISGSSSLAGDSADQIEADAVDTPRGSFSWRYPNTPSALKALWSPDNFTELTKGAVMAFEYHSGLAVDGVPGRQVWKALITAVTRNDRNTFGYTFVHVQEAPSNEREVTWHNGKVVESGAVNTGIAAAPTATGTFAVYLRYEVTTMSGLNPDGTTYHDPGIKWVSYFNGGDALHEYPRASYGFPQSLGCVEMPLSEAAAVWPYTPIGTIVQVA